MLYTLDLRNSFTHRQSYGCVFAPSFDLAMDFRILMKEAEPGGNLKGHGGVSGTLQARGVSAASWSGDVIPLPPYTYT